MNFENPFSDYGKIVRGERFIGRGQIIGVVESRIIQPANPGNLAIVGVHRIGKSSLVYKTITLMSRVSAFYEFCYKINRDSFQVHDELTDGDVS